MFAIGFASCFFAIKQKTEVKTEFREKMDEEECSYSDVEHLVYKSTYKYWKYK